MRYIDAIKKIFPCTCEAVIAAEFCPYDFFDDPKYSAEHNCKHSAEIGTLECLKYCVECWGLEYKGEF